MSCRNDEHVIADIVAGSAVDECLAGIDVLESLGTKWIAEGDRSLHTTNDEQAD
jgi:hypothetical protein